MSRTRRYCIAMHVHARCPLLPPPRPPPLNRFPHPVDLAGNELGFVSYFVCTCVCVAGNLTDEQKQWFIDYYKKLCRVGMPDKQKGADRVSHNRQEHEDPFHNSYCWHGCKKTYVLVGFLHRYKAMLPFSHNV